MRQPPISAERVDWRDIAEQQTEALALAAAEIEEMRQRGEAQALVIARLCREIDELRCQVDESAEVMDRWANESRAASERAREAQRQLRLAESLRRGLVP